MSKLKIIAVLVVVIGAQLLTANMAVGNAATDRFDVSANAYAPTNNLLAAPAFVKTWGGVSVVYRCSWVSGNTQVQITNANQTYAYRTFTANCNGQDHELLHLNTPSYTVLRARIHNYSGQGFTGRIWAFGAGYCYAGGGPVDCY